ncbi:hypothetical protein AB0C27_01475 [Nonomuraea sp. NPDC048882]|uniref:hypothetical protein n=1 Tax=Nonomuraea sp. NPDC048882 TaxID=3154347 RepID=UPI000ADD80C7
MTSTTTPTRRLITLGVALAAGAAVLGTPPAVAATPPEGAYWHTRTLMTETHPGRFGTRAHPYSLVERFVGVRWNAPDGRAWFGGRLLGVRPKTAADRKAWQRDGSPSTWSETLDGKTVKLSTPPGRGSLTAAPKGRDQFEFAGQRLTYDEIQRLPADPARLKAWLMKAGRVGREMDLTAWVEETLPMLLHDIPAPKQVRAAAYQALLSLPGARVHGEAKDELGRSGAALVIDRPGGKAKRAPSTRVRMIVDTGRMVLLAQDQLGTSGGKASAEWSYRKTLIEVGWTDAPPAAPALSDTPSLP